ncbi:hypothetical protein V5H41_29160, partial [Salmonella enterica]
GILKDGVKKAKPEFAIVLLRHTLAQRFYRYNLYLLIIFSYGILKDGVKKAKPEFAIVLLRHTLAQRFYRYNL